MADQPDHPISLRPPKSLLNLSTKQSLLGKKFPLRKMEEKKGPQFSEWRNTAYTKENEASLHGSFIEPDQPEWYLKDEVGEKYIDTIEEKSLTMPRTYQYGPPYETTNFGGGITIPEVEQDWDGLLPVLPKAGGLFTSQKKYLDRDHTKS